MGKDWKLCLVRASVSLVEAVKVMNEAALQIALIVDENEILVGVLTDGDFRRAMLEGISINSNVQKVMNSQPITLKFGQTKEEALKIMKSKKIHQLPVVDQKGKLLKLYTIESIFEEDRKENEVILMAGGLGSRLKDLTKDCPKPLLNVGGKPLLETTILNLKQNGFYKFCFCVNHLSDRLKEYFGNGENLGVQIRYVDEPKRLGTAGALKISEVTSNDPVIVMNGDILTNLKFSQLLDFHENGSFDATMAIRQFEIQVPYGVIETNGPDVIGIQEKPIQSHFINAGVYVFNPKMFDLIPKDEYFDMNNFFDEMMSQKKKIGAFPIHEYWIDIGHTQDYEKANIEFSSYFKKS